MYHDVGGNVESGYTSLDMTKVESKPVYQSLINVERDVVRFCKCVQKCDFFLVKNLFSNVLV